MQQEQRGSSEPQAQAEARQALQVQQAQAADQQVQQELQAAAPRARLALWVQLGQLEPLERRAVMEELARQARQVLVTPEQLEQLAQAAAP